MSLHTDLMDGFRGKTLGATVRYYLISATILAPFLGIIDSVWDWKTMLYYSPFLSAVYMLTLLIIEWVKGWPPPRRDCSTNFHVFTKWMDIRDGPVVSSTGAATGRYFEQGRRCTLCNYAEAREFRI